MKKYITGYQRGDVLFYLVVLFIFAFLSYTRQNACETAPNDGQMVEMKIKYQSQTKQQSRESTDSYTTLKHRLFMFLSVPLSVMLYS